MGFEFINYGIHMSFICGYSRNFTVDIVGVHFSFPSLLGGRLYSFSAFCFHAFRN
jgi:hypothetical protein